MPVAPSQEARNPYLRADSLEALTSWHDLDFVRCAYVTLLGRQPDPSGEAYYGDRIRRGHSKFAILRQLRSSEEARGHDPGIAGLDRVLRMDRIAQWPLVGYLLRKWTGREGDSPVERRLRAIDNNLAVLHAELLCASQRHHHQLLAAMQQQSVSEQPEPPRAEPRFHSSPARQTLSTDARKIFDRVAQQ